jgi:hypothetical protein
VDVPREMETVVVSKKLSILLLKLFFVCVDIFWLVVTEYEWNIIKSLFSRFVPISLSLKIKFTQSKCTIHFINLKNKFSFIQYISIRHSTTLLRLSETGDPGVCIVPVGPISYSKFSTIRQHKFLVQ